MKKLSMSTLTKKSQERLARALSDEDLRTMAVLAGDVSKGIATVEQYRTQEAQMVEKYGFKVRA
jgi:hypothetical protein